MREANQKSLLKALDPFSKGRYLESKVKVLDMPIATGMSLFLGSFSKLFKFISILSIPVQYYKIHSSLLFFKYMATLFLSSEKPESHYFPYFYSSQEYIEGNLRIVKHALLPKEGKLNFEL